MWVREPGWSTILAGRASQHLHVPLSTKSEWTSSYRTGFAKMRQLSWHHPGWRSSARLAYVEKSDPLFVPSLEVARKRLLVCGHYYLP